MAIEKIRGAMSADELKASLDPTTYTGHAEAIVDRVLEQQKGWL
jgi:adenylosuccinate lyase